MSDDLRERIAQAARSAWEGTASTSWEALNEHGRAPWLAQADAVLAVLRDTPTVCRTCGSDDRGVFLSRCVGVVHAWHSEGNR